MTANHLVVIGDTYETNHSRTAVYSYDTTNKMAITLVRRLVFDGNYVSSRRIGDQLYFVMNDTPDSERYQPLYFDSQSGKDAPVVACNQVRIFPRYDQPNYLVIASVPLADGSDAAVV